MKILMLSSYLPYPLYSGGHIRLFNLIKQLSKKHEITLICEKRESQNDEDIKEVAKYCKVIKTVKRKKQWSIKNILKTGFSLDPFLIVGHTNEDMQHEIQTALDTTHFDLIHIETSYITQNLPQTTIPVVLVEHNIEYLVYKRYVDNAPLFLRPLLYVDVIKLYRKERGFWKKADRLVAVTKQDKKVMGEENIHVVPNGVDIDTFTFSKQHEKMYHSIAKHLTMPEKTILFIGDFKWIQNRDTVRWIMNDIWPYLLRSVESQVKIKMWIVGKNIPQNIKTNNKYDSIILDENAPKETREIFKKADILLSPIRVGGGSSYKILEAMASGVPVVTTQLGLDALEAQKEVHALVGEDTRTLVEQTSLLLRNNKLYDTLAKNGRKLIEEKYDWKKIAESLDAVYHAAVKK